MLMSVANQCQTTFISSYKLSGWNRGLRRMTLRSVACEQIPSRGLCRSVLMIFVCMSDSSKHSALS